MDAGNRGAGKGVRSLPSTPGELLPPRWLARTRGAAGRAAPRKTAQEKGRGEGGKKNK